MDLHEMCNPEAMREWYETYQRECRDKALTFLNASFIARNSIEERLHSKMAQYAQEYIAWPIPDIDTFPSSPYDLWIESFLTECGVPEDNMDQDGVDPKNMCCRDWFHGLFLDTSIESLIELAEALRDFQHR